MCGWSIPITIPNQSQLAALVAKKKWALDINIYGPLGKDEKHIWAPGAHILQHMVFIYHCGCMDHQYLSPYQTRAKWLHWLLRKSGPFVFFIWAPGALDLHLWGQMVIHFHSCIIPHTCVKFGPWAYFSFWSTRGVKEICIRPPGAPDLRFGGQNGSEFSSS